MDLFVETKYVNTKKGSLASPTDEQASVNTSETGSGTASNTIILGKSEKSTPDSKKGQYSRKTPLISPEGKKMSEGRAEKAVANATREKVYSREDVGKIIRAAVGKMDASDVESLLFPARKCARWTRSKDKNIFTEFF